MTEQIHSLLVRLWRRRGALLFVTDFTTIGVVFLTAYYLRFHIEFFAVRRVAMASLTTYLQGAFLLALIWTFLIYRDSGYTTQLMNMTSTVLRACKLFSSSLVALGLMMAVSFLYREFLLSRQVYLMTVAGAMISMAGWRGLFMRLDRILASRGIVTRRVVLLGDNEQSWAFAKRVNTLKGTVRVVGLIRGPRDGQSPRANGTDLPTLGQVESLAAAHASSPFETIVVSAEDWRTMRSSELSKSMMEIANFCEAKKIALYACSPDSEIAIVSGEVGTLGGTVMFLIRDASVHPLYAVGKRMFDVVVASVLLVLGLPFWLLLALLAKTTSKGGVFFVQTRAGLHGRPFRMYKFRSMVANAEVRVSEFVDLNGMQEPIFKLKNDPRVTTFGRFLRRTSLDEIPQLINVLKGEMCLIGPRPEELRIVDRYDALQRRRLKGKPGLTGLQQVTNRGETNLAERLRYDLIYLKHQGPLLDLYILIKTVIVVLSGKGVTH